MDLSLTCKNGFYDLDFDLLNQDLKANDSLENAVILSLGTNAREQNLGANANLKPCIGGWWGDSLNIEPFGGYLYEIYPKKMTQKALKDIEKRAIGSLNWLVSDGVAQKVNVKAEETDKDVVLIVEIEKPNGDNNLFTYEMNWRATNGI